MPTLEQYFEDRVRKIPLEPVVLDQPVSIDALPTPALIIDLDQFEANLEKMALHVKARGMGLRCHAKMHKCPIIAKKQIAAGAIGICCATLGEAEVMLAGGIDNILITSPLVTDDKLQWVIRLALLSPALTLVVDYTDAAKRLNQLAGQANIRLKVIMDLDPGMGRTGIQTGQKALALARFIVDECVNLSFCGLQMYIGNCMHTVGFERRRQKYLYLLQKGMDTKTRLEQAGIEVPIFTGGGTGTYDIDAELGALTDLQAGSFIFMDVEYRDIGGQQSDIFDDFAPALSVLTTAISKPQDRLITMDAGTKSLATDTAYPEFRDIEGVVYLFGGDEHGIVQLNNPSTTINLGDRLHIITPHCDPTVNLYDVYYPVRDGMVSEIWPVSARGRSQ